MNKAYPKSNEDIKWGKYEQEQKVSQNTKLH